MMLHQLWESQWTAFWEAGFGKAKYEYHHDFMQGKFEVFFEVAIKKIDKNSAADIV